jgi:hypothetical protein
MTNKFISKGTTFRSEPGPLASIDYVSPDEEIIVACLASERYGCSALNSHPIEH